MNQQYSLGTNDLQKARAFYDPLLSAVGMPCTEETDRRIRYSAGEMQVSIVVPDEPLLVTARNRCRLSLAAESRDVVDAAYRTALQHGGHDGGGPGHRPQYNTNYYGVFVRDPDGNVVEVVTYSPR